MKKPQTKKLLEIFLQEMTEASKRPAKEKQKPKMFLQQTTQSLKRNNPTVNHTFILII